MPRDSSSQAGTSKASDEANDAAARKARRQKRREEEAYQVRGWENLYGGGGSKPVFAHDPLPSSQTRTRAQAASSSSSQPSTNSNRETASSSRRTLSPTKPSGSSSTASRSKLPPSTAPARSRLDTSEATLSRPMKRKASTPSSQASPSKKAKAPAPRTSPQAAAAAAAGDADDSDDDFEITGASGPAATRFSASRTSVPPVKRSPSANQISRSSQPSGSVRRSVSRSISSGRPSPALPSLPANDERPSTASAPASRSSSRSRASAASSASAIPGAIRPTEQKNEALAQEARNAFKQGKSLADHISNIVRDFAAELGADHRDLAIVERFQRKLSELGPQLTIPNLRDDMSELPSRLQKRFGPAIKEYARYLTSDHSKEPGNDASSATTSLTSSFIITAGAPNLTQGPPSASKVSEEKDQRSARNPEQSLSPNPATNPEGPNAAETSTAPDRGVEQVARDRASTSVAAEAESESTTSAAALVADHDHAPEAVEENVADAGHGSCIDSVGSPQAFVTPPASLIDEREEVRLEDASEPQDDQLQPRSEPEMSRHSEASDAEQDAGEDEQEEQEEHGEPPEREDEPEEEDELIDELDEDDQGAHTHSNQGVDAEHSTEESQQHADDASRACNTPPVDVLEHAEESEQEPMEASSAQNAESNGRDGEGEQAHQGSSADENDQPAGKIRADAVIEEPEAAGAKQTDFSEQVDQDSEPQISQGTSHQGQDRDQSTNEKENTAMAPATNAAASDEQTHDTSVRAPEAGQEAIDAESPEEITSAGLGTLATPNSHPVATAVEAPEEALAEQSQLRSDPTESSINTPSIEATVDVPTQEVEGTTISNQEHSEPMTASPEGASEPPANSTAAACVPPTVATPPAPSAPTAIEEDPRARIAQIEEDRAIPGSDAAQQAPAETVEAENPQQIATPPASTTATETLPPSDSAAAAAAVSAIDHADTTAAVASDTGAPTTEQHNTADAAEARDQLGALSTSAAPATSSNADRAESSERRERASSQAASDAGGSRAKKSINDRMKHMLNDLAKVTGRKSSYETILKLKPQRAGLSTPRTVQDLVENWQDPAQMIPWTCLQELGPPIFHKNAHKHMDLSMHELMDKVSNTKSVRHLTEKLPERVMTRALMEFPRVPHMLHCWNEEKKKYFISRKLPQPTDTKPEFRFADEEEEAGGDAGATAGSSLPFEEQERKPWPPVVASSSTVSRTIYSPSAPVPPIPNVVVSGAVTAPRVGPPHQALNRPETLPQGQALNAQLLAAHLAQIVPRPQPPPNLQSNMPQIQLCHVPTVTPQQDVRHMAIPQPQPMVPQPHPPAHRQQTLPQAFFPQARAAPSGLVPGSGAPSDAHLPRPLPSPSPPTQVLNNAQRAAMVKQATERVFSGLAADCLSLAEQVIGSPATDELNARAHFSEADVLHVLDFVVNTYKGDLESERAPGLPRSQAEERFGKIVKVQAAAMQVVSLTKTLCQVKLCLSEAANESLRNTGLASTDDWLMLLATSPRWSALKQHLLRHEPGWSTLSRSEMALLLRRQVGLVNRRLESVLEQLMGMDEIVGRVRAGADEEEIAAHEAIRKECEQIGRICCKHVVGTLVGDAAE